MSCKMNIKKESPCCIPISSFLPSMSCNAAFHYYLWVLSDTFVIDNWMRQRGKVWSGRHIELRKYMSYYQCRYWIPWRGRNVIWDIWWREDMLLWCERPFGPPLLGPFSGIVATVHSAVSHLTLHYVSEVNKMLLDTALDRSFMIIAANCVDKYLKATGNVVLRVTPVRNITPLFYMIVLTDILSHALHRSHYVQQHYCTA